MKKSLIISWITACDYPLFRAWLHEYGFFDEIIIYFDVQFRHPFFWAFIQQDLANVKNIKFIDPVSYDFETSDWRTTSTNELLKHATGDWIFSIEQDWCVKDWKNLFGTVYAYLLDSKEGPSPDLIGWMNPTNNPYIHPAFWAIKRETLEKTSKDFSAHPEINGSDHFAMITYDVKKIGAEILSLQELGYNCDFSPQADMFHLGGINQNYLNGLTEGFEFHRPDAFMVYNQMSKNASYTTFNPINTQVSVKQDLRFYELCTNINTKLETMGISYNKEWEKFFKI